ncbi:hypothetical protein [Streptomyces sp. CoH27]|uniref:hypothetical protein n=1 Tax=Streptomyces sp. CoH27 TaxID=2875763 RepID=UPI001CD6702B|nr:hypothetical protein [Streptomyces sp. CoH27]
MTTRTSPLWLSPPELLPAHLTALSDAAARPAPTHHGPARPLPNAREADYDAYFGIARTPYAPAHTLVQALGSAVAEVRAWASPLAEPALRAALAACGLPESTPPGRGGDAPLTRWKAGHRLFLALTQATVVALRDGTAHGTRRHPAPAGTHTAAVLLRACAAAMRLTASFTPHAYAAVVRPSMEPPAHTMDGFSGLWSADHRTLVQQLRTWGSVHAGARCGGCTPHRELSAALDEVHTAHHGVCVRFVGRRPSLVGGHDDAPATLTRLAGARRRLLHPYADAATGPEATARQARRSAVPDGS